MALLTKVKTRVTIHARRKVSALLDGQYTSVAAGRSLDFSDLRAYVPGDDVADIDWKASARHGDLLVKRYVAERKHTVLVVVDTGREMAGIASWNPEMGDRKGEVAIVAAGLFGWIGISHGDQVGVLCSTENGPTAFRPSGREVELERMLEQVQSSCTADSPPQRTLDLLDHAAAAVRRRTIMVLVLGDVEFDAEVERRIRRLVAQHELIVLTVADVDPLEPMAAGHAARDLVTGRRLPRFASAGAALSAELAEADAARATRREEVLARWGVPHLLLREEAETVPRLLALLEGMRRVR